MSVNLNTMNKISLENKIKKKCPNIYVKDISPFDNLVVMYANNGVGKTSLDAKDLYLLDIQMCICQIFCRQLYTVWPRWCQIVKPENFSSVNLIVFDELSTYIWSECLIKYGQSKKFRRYYELLMAKLNISTKFINPKFYGLSWKSELFEIPTVFLSKKFNLMQNVLDESEKPDRKRTSNGQLKTLLHQTADTTEMIRLKYDLHFDGENGLKLPQEKHKDSFPRTKLLMNLQQMRQENIPHSDAKNFDWLHFKYSQPGGYTKVSDNSPMFAVDCEMVQCYDDISRRSTKGLASVSIVNENKEIIYNTYVKPDKNIIDYLTKYSGITKEIVQSATKTLLDVQREMAEILPSDAILVGHSIGNDLEALEIFHPYIMDTSVIYNLRCSRFAKSRLKDLTFIFLNREIQNKGKLGHDALEDAIATMDLVLLKLSKSLDFGDLARIVESNSNEKDNSDKKDQAE